MPPTPTPWPLPHYCCAWCWLSMTVSCQEVNTALMLIVWQCLGQRLWQLWCWSPVTVSWPEVMAALMLIACDSVLARGYGSFDVDRLWQCLGQRLWQLWCWSPVTVSWPEVMTASPPPHPPTSTHPRYSCIWCWLTISIYSCTGLITVTVSLQEVMTVLSSIPLPTHLGSYSCVCCWWGMA